MEKIINRLNTFNSDRDWDQFHSPANLAKSIVIETAELLDNFQWSDQFDSEKVKEELADVLLYAFQLAEKLNLDIVEIMHQKIDLNELKYPVEKSKGLSKKYTDFGE